MNDYSDYTVEELEAARTMIKNDLSALNYDWHVIAPQWRAELVQIDQELTRR